MSEVVTYERAGEIGVITIDNPPVNALSRSVRQGLWEALDVFNGDTGAGAAVLLCAGGTFIAGADITEFDRPSLSPLLPRLIAKLEQSPKLVVAALHGTALGGGFETACGCHYRCALATAAIGQPEVNLGLIPGAGGTQRLPRLVGIERALDLILTGRQITAVQARDWGAIDAIIEGDLREGAIGYARRLLATAAPLRRVCDMTVDTTGIDTDFFIERHKEIAATYRGYFAPVQILNCIEAAVTMPFDEALDLERELFEECKLSPHSRAQRHLFFAERNIAKIADIPRGTPLREVKRVGVLGAGTMGSGIAMTFLNAGYPVTLVEAGQEALDRGLASIRSGYTRAVDKGRMTGEEAARHMERLSTTLRYEELAAADLVIEAVFEDMDLKQQVFRRLGSVCRPGAILATNTSALDVNAIAAVATDPEAVIGMHFFAPVTVLPIFEVIRGSRTARDVVATIMEVGRRIGKIAVPVGVCYGFVGNRVFIPYLREAQLLLLEGVPVERIDQVAYDWGMAMGPNAVIDLSGADIFHNILGAMPGAGEDPSFCRMVDVLYEAGRLGQKSGAGFYRYQGRTRVPDPEVAGLVQREARRLGIRSRTITDEEIVERLFYSVINEGARILEEGIVPRSGDIDVVFTSGFGMPRYRGGPMIYGDMTGLKQVYEAICHYRKVYGDRYWTPAGLLEQLAAQGGTFEEWSRERQAAARIGSG